MLSTHKQQTIAALKRLNGLSRKVEQMVQEDAPCPSILEMILAMKGHVEHMQARVLESHLHTCAPKQLVTSGKKQDAFIGELLRVIGLSRR
jgi:DNA-binding FrmR family transcriptional regulator